MFIHLFAINVNQFIEADDDDESGDAKRPRNSDATTTVARFSLRRNKFGTTDNHDMMTIIFVDGEEVELYA